MWMFRAVLLLLKRNVLSALLDNWKTPCLRVFTRSLSKIIFKYVAGLRVTRCPLQQRKQEIGYSKLLENLLYFETLQHFISSYLNDKSYGTSRLLFRLFSIIIINLPYVHHESKSYFDSLTSVIWVT